MSGRYHKIDDQSAEDSRAVDQIIIRHYFPNSMTFADFNEVDNNLATFEEIDSELDPSSTSETITREVDKQE